MSVFPLAISACFSPASLLSFCLSRNAVHLAPWTARVIFTETPKEFELGLGRMGCGAMLVPKEVADAFDPDHDEAGLGERCEQVRTRDTRNPAHDAMVMRWIRTKSKVCYGAPATW